VTEVALPVTATISDPAPLRRDDVTVTGTGFAPEERVTASLPSRNRGELGAAAADDEGSVTITFRVPSTLPEGDQEVLLTGTSSAQAGTGFALRPLLQDLLVRLVRWWQVS
jgi:5'-nucleotidase